MKNLNIFTFYTSLKPKVLIFVFKISLMFFFCFKLFTDFKKLCSIIYNTHVHFFKNLKILTSYEYAFVSCGTFF